MGGTRLQASRVQATTWSRTWAADTYWRGRGGRAGRSYGVANAAVREPNEPSATGPRRDRRGDAEAGGDVLGLLGGLDEGRVVEGDGRQGLSEAGDKGR